MSGPPRSYEGFASSYDYDEGGDDVDDGWPRECFACGGEGFIEGVIFGWDEGQSFRCHHCGGSGLEPVTNHTKENKP